MKKVIFIIAILAASTIIVYSFFQPWAVIKTSVTGVSKELTETAQTKLGNTPIAGKFIDRFSAITDTISKIGDVELKSTVRGNNIPALVNNNTSKVALALTQILFKNNGTEGLDKKSYLVYLLPLLGIFCTILVLLGLKYKISIIIMTVLSGAISIIGIYNLNSMDIVTPIVKISIESGLWNTMYAYAFIAFVGFLWLVLPEKK
ncbi:MAG: hypothetical protein ABIH85_06025 [Candidatus Omnitrophota bacterium]|nr:hypothetical protein [Candidatus Omnitrophota bacterium]MBU1894582.1 hypothetical protein [Candidatus Omnitrophota bacterium]